MRVAGKNLHKRPRLDKFAAVLRGFEPSGGEIGEPGLIGRKLVQRRLRRVLPGLHFGKAGPHAGARFRQPRQSRVALRMLALGGGQLFARRIQQAAGLAQALAGLAFGLRGKTRVVLRLFQPDAGLARAMCCHSRFPAQIDQPVFLG